jgi:type II secretory pathway pseudopilin PulG
MRYIAIAVLLLGCGPKPEERYFAAMNKKLEGDARGYYSELIALAHDEPDSRAGRRARVTLQSGGLVSEVAVVGVLVGIAVPNFVKFQGRAKQSEAATLLRALSNYQRGYYAEFQRYSGSVPESFAAEMAPRTYYLFLGMQGGPALAPSDSLQSPVSMQAALGRLGVSAGVTKQGFVAAAVGNLDGDADYDVWVIDEDGNLVHLANDLD